MLSCILNYYYYCICVVVSDVYILNKMFVICLRNYACTVFFCWEIFYITINVCETNQNVYILCISYE